MKQVVTSNAPRPVGPYSQGIIAGGLLFCSGQIALDPATGELLPGDAAVQTDRVLQNLLAVLTEAKMGLDNVVKATVYLADIADFAKMNEVFSRYFGDRPPARTTLQVAALPRGARVEIDLIAVY